MTGAISPGTAIRACAGWPLHVAWADRALAPRTTRSVAAMAAASMVNNAVLTRRLRPGRYRPGVPVRPVVPVTSPDLQSRAVDRRSPIPLQQRTRRWAVIRRHGPPRTG